MKIFLFALSIIISAVTFTQNMPEQFVKYSDELMDLPFTEQLASLKKKIKKYPTEPWYYYIRAGVYGMMNDEQNELKDYNKILEINPNFAPAHSQLFTIYKNDSTKFELALKHIEKAIELEPDEFYNYILRGRLLLAEKKYNLAYADGMKVINMENADHAPAVQLLTEILIAKNEKDKLKSIMTNIDYTSYGGFMDAKFDMLVGDLYLSYGDNDKACKSYRFAAETFEFIDEPLPEDLAEKLKGCPQMMSQEMWSYYEEIEFLPLEEKLKSLDQRIAENPSEPYYYYFRGEANQDEEKFANAIADYKKALELDSNFANAYANLAKCVYANDKTKFENAIELISKAIRLDPNNTFYYMIRGNMYLAELEYKHAEADGNAILNIYKGEVLFGIQILSEVYLAEKNMDKLKILLSEYDLANYAEFMGTDDIVKFGDLYLKFGEKDKACSLFNAHAQSNLEMDFPIPEILQERVEKCSR